CARAGMGFYDYW
nr:immunoglobulin heavy chain junction region [Macaca mulatta]